MKQLIRSLLIGFLALSSLNAAELLFDLKAQDFKNTLDWDAKAAKYKVSDKVIVDTNMKLDKGTYRVYRKDKKIDVAGHFNVALSTPVSNWKASCDFIIRVHFNTESQRSIKFTDNFGETIVLNFDLNGLKINEKEFKASMDKSLILVNVSVTEKNLLVKINNQVLVNEKTPFEKLQFVDTNFYSGKYEYYDTLHKIVLVSND